MRYYSAIKAKGVERRIEVDEPRVYIRSSQKQENIMMVTLSGSHGLWHARLVLQIQNLLIIMSIESVMPLNQFLVCLLCK